ncbi:hypothetical protein DRW07_08655 [Alteromonas sediminis]|uniref:Carbamoyltransferase n=2 Tax=Alteromonas sediminis TaxID=2259342 RepID=A0A3N5Y8Y6_9ALTE|nr:carbamoyltransferase [Alteromonas sediminis]RPJ67689.1 hypothetical protein DRW07_08655 [Alteromonas sediminis]
MQKILGISAFYHDSAAALLVNGNIVAAAQEERFTRQKHDPRFPSQAIQYCLSEGQLTLDDLDAIVFYDKPLLKFERLLETFLAHAPKGFKAFLRAMPIWLKEKLYLKQLLRRECRALLPDPEKKSDLPPLLFTEHHQSHAASAFFPSPFTEATVVCLDGVGEWATTSVWHGKGRELVALEEIQFPHSLGLLYSAFTYYCGFKVNAGEYKLMGLAPYGKPIYADQILTHLIDLREDGSFALNMDYFDFAVGDRMTNARFHALFGGEPYPFDGKPDQRCMDLARSIQDVIEKAVMRIVKHAVSLTGCAQVCMAGGVALNCVANGKLFQQDFVHALWVQPAAGDAGGALGAALMAFYAHNAVEPDAVDSMQGAYLGPAYSELEVSDACAKWQAPYQILHKISLPQTVATWLTQGDVVGWFQGRMEFGPRALGNRSILGDPRQQDMQRTMNLKIKQRESFRPFAPAVLVDAVDNYFSPAHESPYMLSLADVKTDNLPAITHVDKTARLQTVSRQSNPDFYQVIAAFGEVTGIPMLINTSFNVRGEPPVCSPDDAIRCFLATDMDRLVMGNIVLDKNEQSADAIRRAKQVTFEKD